MFKCHCRLICILRKIDHIRFRNIVHLGFSTKVSGYHIGMDISPDGSLVASGSSNGFLYVYNYSTTKISNTFELSKSQPCMDVAWSLSSPSLLASCDWSGQIYFHR